MCDPITAIAVASTTATVASGVSNAKAAKRQGREAARQGQFNAQMAEYAALDAERRGREEAAAIQRQANSLKGEQRAAAAANGLTAGYGTLGVADAQANFFADIDAQTALDDAAMQANTARTQGAEAVRAGNAAQKQAYRSANATLLNTGLSVAAKWLPAPTPGASPLRTTGVFEGNLPTRGGA